MPELLVSGSMMFCSMKFAIATICSRLSCSNGMCWPLKVTEKSASAWIWSSTCCTSTRRKLSRSSAMPALAVRPTLVGSVTSAQVNVMLASPRSNGVESPGR